MIYLIGDTHFYHKNIIRFCNRPYEDVEEMNRALIANWNSVVGHDDIVYHLGDFGFKASRKWLHGILAALNGTKVLIKGNHDKGTETMYNMGFNVVLEKAVIQVPGTEAQYLLQHYPIYDTDELEELLIALNCHGLIHGHVHNNDGEDVCNGFRMNVSAEVIDYTPIDILTLHKMYTQYTIRNGLFLHG